MDKNILFLHFKMLYRRTEFKLIMMFCLLLSMGSFMQNLSYSFGQDITTVSTAFDMWIGISGRSFKGFLLFLLPLFSAIPYSDIYYEYKKNKFNTVTITRVDKRKYILTTSIVVFLSGFIIVLFSLVINQILCLIAYPIEYTYNPLYNIYYGSDSLFYPVNVNFPYLYNLIYMLIISSFSGVFALLSYGISFIYKKNRISIVLIPFILYIVSDFIMHALQVPQYSIYYILSPGKYHSYGLTESYFLLIFTILIIISYLMINRGIKSDEL